MTVRVTTSPVETPVTLDELKEHLRVDGNGENNALSNLLHGVVDTIEQSLRRALITRTLTLTAFNVRYVRLPFDPDPEILSVKSGEEDIDFTQQGNKVDLNGTYSSVVVVYKAGYGLKDAVPAAIKQEILNMAIPMYERRGSDYQREIKSALARISPYRINRVQ